MLLSIIGDAVVFEIQVVIAQIDIDELKVKLSFNSGIARSWRYRLVVKTIEVPVGDSLKLVAQFPTSVLILLDIYIVQVICIAMECSVF